jgi:hypothetical protein
VAHPAAKLLVMAAQAQEAEIGDGTNLVVTFGGELLGMAEELIRDGTARAQRRPGNAIRFTHEPVAPFISPSSSPSSSPPS